MVCVVVGGLYCSCVEVAIESLCLYGDVVSADEVKWAFGKVRVLACISKEVCCWCEMGCGCVKEVVAVVAAVVECVCLIVCQRLEW